MGKINAFIRHLITPQYEEVGWEEKGSHMERSADFRVNFLKLMLGGVEPGSMYVQYIQVISSHFT